MELKLIAELHNSHILVILGKPVMVSGCKLQIFVLNYVVYPGKWFVIFFKNQNQSYPQFACDCLVLWWQCVSMKTARGTVVVILYWMIYLKGLVEKRHKIINKWLSRILRRVTTCMIVFVWFFCGT